jgi:hypothetical protein
LVVDEPSPFSNPGEGWQPAQCPGCDFPRRYGRYTALGLGTRARGHVRVRVRCDCGTQKEVRLSVLRTGASQSCGCLARELTTSRQVKHGQSGERTLTYRSWLAMRERCSRPSHPHFASYGGRGISVCPRWDSFEVFLSDMGPRPSKDHSLDRYPNNDGNYEPGNVRWATPKQQGRNRRSNHLIRGRTLAEWSERTGLSTATIRQRLLRGWSEEEAVGP